MAKGVSIIQANKLLSMRIKQYAIRVAIEDEKLHDLQKAEAACEVQKNTSPLMQLSPIVEIIPLTAPSRGMERKAPMAATCFELASPAG